MQYRFNESAAMTGRMPAGTSPAAQQWVTREELLQVLQAHRQRQQAGNPAEKVALGEALRELNLDLTPEQVWEEVLAQRATAALPSVRMDAGKSRRIALRVSLAVLVFTFLPVTMGLLMVGRARVAQPAFVQSPPLRPFPAVNDPRYPLLSTISDGTPVFLDFGSLQQLAGGQADNTIHAVREAGQAGRSGGLNGLWRVIRENGNYLAEVWVTPQDGLKLMNGQAARVYGARPATADLGPLPDRSLRVPVARLLGPQTQYQIVDGAVSAIDTLPQR